MKLRFLPSARREFLEAVTFYEQQATGLGMELIQELGSALEGIKATPRMGAPFEQNTRRLPLQRFPHSIVYLIENSSILIVAVTHHRRRPGYWKGRLG